MPERAFLTGASDRFRQLTPDDRRDLVSPCIRRPVMAGMGAGSLPAMALQAAGLGRFGRKRAAKGKGERWGGAIAGTTVAFVKTSCFFMVLSGRRISAWVGKRERQLNYVNEILKSLRFEERGCGEK